MPLQTVRFVLRTGLRWAHRGRLLRREGEDDPGKQQHQREQRLRAQFSKDIAKIATLKKKTFDMVAMIHKFDLRGPHYDPTKFDELTKWMRIYEKEILIAMDNYDAAAYVFFFEEFAKLTIQRAGMINPDCKLKDCECRNYKN